jgi:hypothetical protein
MQGRMRRITGLVTQALISPGSKSEHRGVILRTARGEEFVLRRVGGNAFHDEILEALVRKTITGRGTVVGRTFIMKDWLVNNDQD